MDKTKTKFLIWHSPRTGSNLLCNMLHQTQVAGIASYLHCGFPLGSLGEIAPNEFQKKLMDYEKSQTTHNGVFGCKLSWEGLRNLTAQVGLHPVMQWLGTIDHHFYLYRTDTIAQAVSLYIAQARKYYSTLKTDEILPTPAYSYDQIAFFRRKVLIYQSEMEGYFEDYKIAPVRISFESMTRHHANLREVTSLIANTVSGTNFDISDIEPEIKKQTNHMKQSYRDRFLLEYSDK